MKRIATLLTVFALLLLSLSTMAVTVGAVDYEAELTVGTTTTNYETLNEALLAAYAAADETTTPSVKLLKDVSMTDRLDWNKEAAFTLDLNDKILDGFDVNTGVWMENGKITVVDTAQTKTTKYYTVNDDGLWVKTNAVTERAVVGGILTSGNSGNIVDSTGGEVVMNGVSVVGGESGIRISAAASFNNVNFCGNLGTGAVEIATAETCTFTGCRFYENRYTATNIAASYSGGGAICVEYGTAPTIQVQNCDFQGNQSNEYGGAIFCSSNVRLLVQGCTFQKNHAERLGGAICIKNTGDISSPSDKCVLIDTVITDNTAGENGGGIYYEKTPEKASCFVAGSMVTMADGTTKKIEEIKVGDEVKTFDHETGCLSSAKVYLAWEDKVTPQPTFKLHFDGDLTVHCIASHTFLEKELRKYVTVSLDNAEDFIGRYFFAEDGAWHELLDVTVEKNETVLYEFYTEKHQNGFVGGMLSAPTDVAHLLNIYELDENLKADEAVLQNDIETYGLVSYEYAFETSGMSEEWFEAAGTKYLFIAIGKGLVTLEEAMGYYAETQTEDTQAPLPLMLSTPLLTSAPMLTNALLLTAAADPLPDLGDFSVGVLSLGKNVTVIDNKVGENESNVYLASGYIKLCDNHSGILAGVTLPYDTENSKEGDGQFTSNGALADRALFFHDGETYAVKFDNTNESAPFLALTAGYKVTAATCQNGKVGVLGNNNVFLPEDVVTLSATPDDGYVLNKITAKYNDGTKDCDLTVTDGKITMPAYDVTVCASFVKAYTVTYETNGGSTVANAYGAKIVFPAEDPTKDGCIFDGWYTDSTLKSLAVADTAITQNTTLFAKWATPLTFTAEQANSTVKLKWSQGSDFYYRTKITSDTYTEWTTYGSGTTVTLSAVGDSVQFKGLNIVTTGQNGKCFAMTGKIAASGDVTSLTNGVGGDAALTIDNCYNRLFMDCSALTQAPNLPSTTLSKGCYQYIFASCTSLPAGPETLPAEILPESCYNGMFYGCTALTSAPVICGTTLNQGCCGYMFYGCKVLNLPEGYQLPAETMAKSCYNEMFEQCHALTRLPVLKATTLAESCFFGMFRDCKGLVTVPADYLPVTVLVKDCYDRMFYNCTALTKTPALPATDLAEKCYANMFVGCSALKNAPALPASAMKASCYHSMFSNCTSLESVPDLSHVTTLADYCFGYMFSGCKALTKVPALPVTVMTPGCYSSMFSNCTGLESVPDLSHVKTLAESCFGSMFAYCTGLDMNTGDATHAIAWKVNATTTEDADGWNDSMFYGCDGVNLGSGNEYNEPVNGTTYYQKSLSITYNTTGGSTVANAYGTKIVFPAEDPTKDGCIFDGWYTDSTLKIKAVAGTEMTANTTLYANWISVIKTQPNQDKTNDYTVVVDDSLIGQVAYQWYEYVDGISDVALTGETSSKFAGTDLSDASYYCVIFKGGNAIAKTDKLTPACISFSGAKGAAGTAPETVYQLEGRSVTLPANPFTADGGTFAGWSDGETAYAANGTYTVSGNTGFTAKLEHTCHNLVFDTVLCEETMNYQNYSEWNKYYELPSGNYYLANDLTLTASITLLGKTAICLNGHVLNLNGYSINGWGYDLILVDCQVNDAHPHYYKVDEESGFWTLSDALDYDKTVTGGVITGGASDNSAISVGTLIAEDVNFIGNGTSEIEKGGAAHVITASIRRCRFFGNVAEKGGALYADNELAVYSTEFLDNRATVDGGAVYAIGKARIENCTLKNNQATQKGGAAVFACKSSGSGAFTVLGTVISDNKAGVSGGGIAFDKAGCFAEGTKITMADGTKKNIENVKVGDLVKTFNHETGAFESGKVSYVFEGSTPATYFTLSFESGKTLNIYDCHDLFEKTANKYVTVTAMNCQDFIGHEFYNAEDGVWETLASATPDAGEANYYSIYVYDTQNCLANGMLSVPDDVDFILNVYEFDSETLKANEQTLAADIAKYGLFTFEECKLCDSKEMFDDANLQYKNLYIGKGLITAFDLNEFYYSVHGVDEYTKGLEGFAVVLGKNVVIKNNKVGENVSNVALDKGALIYVVDGAAGIEAGVSLSDTVGIFAKNVYTNDADKIVFTSDVAGLSQNKTASETTPVTYTYSFSYIKEQPCKNNDYTVLVEETLTGVTYQWYKYVDGENDVALTGETNAKLGTTVLAEASYYCKLSKGGAEIAESDFIAPVAVSFAGGTDATGTTPATVYQLEGRKITLPENPYTKTGYKFDKWETYAAGSDYTVGSSIVTLTAAWTEKATLTIDSTAQESEIGDSLSPYAVKCTETSTGFTVSYRKYTAEAWSTAAPNDIGVYQVRIERAEDDTYKAVDLSFVGGYGIYYLFTFSDAGATSGKAPNPIKSTVGLADFNPDTSALVSANTLAKEGFVQDGWLAEREGELVKWETRGTSTSVVFYPCWKPVVKTLDKDNDFGVTLSGTDISYQWYAYTAVAFDDIDSENYAFVYGTYDAQTKTITSTGDGGMNIIAVFLDPDFASTASYLSCKFSCDEENDYYDFDSNYLNPDASQLYRVNVVDIDGELYLYIYSFAPFTASDLTLYVPKALSGETKNKTEKISGADIVCRVSYINRVGELTFVSSTLSNTVTPVKISFAGGEDVTGTAPADMYQLEGRKINFPANPFTKTGYKFDKWGTYAADSDYTVGDSDVTLTAAWVIKTAVSIAETAQNVTYNGKGQGFAFKGTHKDIGDFTVRYYVGSVWTTEAPTNAGTYDVKIERAEDDTYASYEKTVSGGFVIDKYVVPEADITLVTDNFTYNGKNQANALTASYKDVDGKAVALVLGTCNLSNVNGKKMANFTDAGDYTAVFLFTSPFESDNYALVYEEDGDYYEAYFTMKPKEVQIDWASDNFTYNGNVQTVTASYKDVDGKTVSLTVGVTDFKNAGEYTAAASFANSETNYALPAVATKNYTMAKANAEAATVPTAKTLTYDGTRMTLVNEGVGIDGTMQYKLSGGTYGTTLPTATNAGTYVVFYKVVGDENHNDTAEATVTVTVEKLAIDEPTVLGTYKYTGEEQTVLLNGVLPGMRTTDSLTKTDAGIYEAHFTLDENHRWNDGSDGVVSWEIKPVKIAPQEESTADEPKKQDVFVETEEGFPSDVTVIVEVTVESSVVEKISDNSMSVDYYNLQNEDIKLQNDEKVGVVFNVKLLRTTGNSTVEIQPEDIAPGTKIKVKMLIPADVDVTKVTRILHVHTPDDIEEIPFDASRIDSEGYYEIEIDRLSEFAFIYERDFIHWIILAWFVALLVFVSVLWFALSIHRFCEEKKLHAAPVVGFVLHALGTAFLAFFALCVWCYVGLIANAAALIVFVLIYLGVFGKNNSEAKKEKIPDSTEAFAPVETAPVDTSEDELSLKDAMRAATVAHADIADSVNKKTVAAFLTKTYGDAAEVNCRENYIKSGILPLADTHYKKFENGKKCFIYVYELKDGKVFFLVRADEKTAEKIKSEHPAFMHSAYPKTKEHDWYTLILDDSFRTSREVFDTLAFVFEKFTRDNCVES